eukprot:m.10665 g.10665  ORF g.10665 m.10665 type:complete len:148 (+) comp7460_c0_seq1:112-555(+)
MPRTIVVAFDWSQQSANALHQAVKLFANDDTTIHILHCYMPLIQAVGQHFSRQPTENQEELWKKQNTDDFKEHLKNAMDQIKAPFKHELEVLEGDARDELISFAEKIGAETLVVGATGKGILKRAIIGSVSNYVVNHSKKIPVLIVH